MSCFEGDDLFFDSSDCFRSSVGSPASSEENFAETGSWDFRNFECEFHHQELKSVRERRRRFLRGMDLHEIFSGTEEGGERTSQSCCSRSNSIGSGISGSLKSPVHVEERDSFRCIRDLDNGRKYIVHSLGPDGLPTMFKEVGSDRLMTLQEFEAFLGISEHSIQGYIERDAKDLRELPEKWIYNSRERKFGRWWRGLCRNKNDVSIRNSTLHRSTRTQVQKHRKRFLELTALYKGQEIIAHKGLIRVLRFNNSGWYLASGGEDCMVRIWQVLEEEAASCKLLNLKESLLDDVRGGKLIPRRKKNCRFAPVIIPKKVFRIAESPLHEFLGHTSDILDLSWSSSDCILSSSKDKTVRMWNVGCGNCLKVFRHNDYVTCIQFNPVDGRYFISGSIDGKVRIWGVSENRVLNWADMREIVTAVCYKPDGTGFVVGSMSGKCRIFDHSGDNIRLNRELQIQSKKKSSGKRITGLQFSPDDSKRIMISSADSSIRIVDGHNIVCKFRGLRKSKSQLSASFTGDGRYAVSVDEDSRIYIWNTGNDHCRSPAAAAAAASMKTVRSCELFSSVGATVAVPWPRGGRDTIHLIPNGFGFAGFSPRTAAAALAPPLPPSLPPPPDRFSFGVWLFSDVVSKGSATWPEERLSSAGTPERVCCHRLPRRIQTQKPPPLPAPLRLVSLAAPPWSLVIVSANDDGTIRSYHNYGLPVRL